MKKDLRQKIADLILMLLIVCLSLIFVYFVAVKMNKGQNLLADYLSDIYQSYTEKIPSDDDSGINYDYINFIVKPKVNFIGAEVLDEPDTIMFYDSKGNIFNAVYSDDGEQIIAPIGIYDLNDVLVSSVELELEFWLPGITKDQSWEITFDYYTRSYNVKIIDQASIYETH